MNVETQIKLNKFKPRAYQLPILDAIENKGYKRVLAILPRRAGKDLTCWQLCIRQCLKKRCNVIYIFPTFTHAKRVIWNSITNEGERFLDYIPEELIDSKNSQELTIRFKNGSLLQLLGSDNIDALRGINCHGAVFSEYAWQDPRVYSNVIRPILTANGGWAVFISTPKGRNHLFELYEIARNSPDWFCYKLTVEDTQHISLQEIEREKHEGIMSDTLIQQEYYTDFSIGEGSYYSRYVDRIRLKGQIGPVPYEPGFKVHTSWDLGYSDSTTIIFFQLIGTTVRVIDHYENQKLSLEHYAKVLQNKDYVYGQHIAPHDIAVHEFSSGMARIDRARQLGIRFTIAPNLSIEDGIETVRCTLPKMWIDEFQCAYLIKALENYQQEFDSKNKVYRERPKHDWSSHTCDAFRYLCLSLGKLKGSMSAEDLDRLYNEAMGRSNTNLPPIFRDDLPKLGPDWGGAGGSW